MTKKEAMALFGCETISELSIALNVSQPAISQWSDPLPEHAVRRIESRLYRRIAGRKRRATT